MTVSVVVPRHARSQRDHGRSGEPGPDRYRLREASHRASVAVGTGIVRSLERIGLAVIDRFVLQQIMDGSFSLPEEVRLGEYSISPGHFLLTRNGQEISLTPTEWRILLALLDTQGFVVTSQRLLTIVWGPESVDDCHMLRVHIARLRAKLEPEARGGKAPYRFICTVPGVGYYCGLLREQLMAESVMPGEAMSSAGWTPAWRPRSPDRG